MNDPIAYIARRLRALDAFLYGDAFPITRSRILSARAMLDEVERALDTLYRTFVIRFGLEAELAPVFGKDYKNLLEARERLDLMEVTLQKFDGLDDPDIYAFAADQVRPACPDCGLAVTLPDDVTDPTDYWVGRCPEGHVHLYELEEEETDR